MKLVQPPLAPKVGLLHNIMCWLQAFIRYSSYAHLLRTALGPLVLFYFSCPNPAPPITPTRPLNVVARHQIVSQWRTQILLR